MSCTALPNFKVRGDIVTIVCAKYGVSSVLVLIIWLASSYEFGCHSCFVFYCLLGNSSLTLMLMYLELCQGRYELSCSVHYKSLSVGVMRVLALPASQLVKRLRVC